MALSIHNYRTFRVKKNPLKGYQSFYTVSKQFNFGLSFRRRCPWTKKDNEALATLLTAAEDPQ